MPTRTRSPHVSGRRLPHLIAAAGLALSAAHLGAAPVPQVLQDPQKLDQETGHLALADDFADLARQAGASRPLNGPAARSVGLHQTAALLRAACTECPVEPRFPRLMTEAYVELKDGVNALDAIKRYRNIDSPEVNNDQTADVEYIDLVLANDDKVRQSSDAQLNYLRSILDVASLASEVRSHAAFKCSEILRARMQGGDADKMLDQALRLNPLSPEALQRKWERVQQEGTAPERAATLVALLKSNPAQPAVMATLADQLTGVGLLDAGITWYDRSFQLTRQFGMSLDPTRYGDYAAALYCTDQYRRCREATDKLLQADPTNVDAALINLMVARQLAAGHGPVDAGPVDPNAVDRAKAEAMTALSAEIGLMHTRLNGGDLRAPAATQPGDLSATIAADLPKLAELKKNPSDPNAGLLGPYSAALADLAFYQSYFDPQPAAASKTLDALRSLRPANDPQLTRLEGFAFLADGKRDEAKVKFSAVADQDFLAKMGLVLLAATDPSATPDAKQAAATDARGLVSAHPDKLGGALLLDALRDKGGKFVASDISQSVANQVAAFPVKLLDLLVPGQTESFYNLLAEPLKVMHPFGDPIIAKVSIHNSSDFDLTVGTNGAIHPDLWFDASVQGAINQEFSGVAYDRIAGPLVLHAHAPAMPGTSQYVRVDSAQLMPILESNPIRVVSLLFNVFTNPISQGNGNIAPGPGGYRKPFSRPVERVSTPINPPNAIQDVITRAAGGSIRERIETLDLMRSLAMFLQQQIAQTQKSLAKLNADAAAAADNPDPNAPPPAAPDPNAPPTPQQQAQGAIQSMTEITQQLHDAMQRSLRDPEPIVRYWAEFQLAHIDTPAQRQVKAQQMSQESAWEPRVLALVLASSLPMDQQQKIGNSLLNDSEPAVKELAQAVVDYTNLPPAATQPTSQPATQPAPNPAAPPEPPAQP